MQRLLLFSFLLLLVCPPLRAGAEESVPFSPALSLEERVQRLEIRQAELYHTLAEKKAGGPGEVISPKLTLSGLLAVEATASRLELAEQGVVSSSDLLLATVQLGLDARINEQVGAHLALLYEEDGEVEVDEALIELQQGAWSARVGRQYLPFGAFHSHFITEPLTQSLGEIRQTALLAGYVQEPLQLAAFACTGTADRAGGEAQINAGGASLTLTPWPGTMLGVSLLSDLAATRAELLAGSESHRRVAGGSAFAHVEEGRLTLDAEVLGAARVFAVGDLDADADRHGDQPLSWNLEAAWALRPELKLAGRYAGSRDLSAAPQRQYGVVLAYSPWPETTIAGEYLHDRFRAPLAPATNAGALARRDQLTVQLALAF